jgi:hypothetical protein
VVTFGMARCTLAPFTALFWRCSLALALADMEACHYPDSDRSNNRLDNLRWDTHLDRAILLESEVARLRRALESISQATIGQFGAAASLSAVVRIATQTLEKT